MVKNLPASARDPGSIHGQETSPAVGNSSLLQYSCLGNPMDRGTQHATVHGIAKSQRQLSVCVEQWGRTFVQLIHPRRLFAIPILPDLQGFFFFEKKEKLEI